VRTVISAILLAAACGGAAGGGAGRAASIAGSPVAVSPIALHAPARLEAPARIVVRSAAALADVWARLYAGVPQPPPLPAVDFAREMVLVAALGARPSGGHGVAIARAALDGGVLRVEVVETRPGAGCMTTQVITYPVAAARVALHDGAVEFVDRVETNDCR